MSPRISGRARNSTVATTRSTSTATTRWKCSPARVRRSATRFSTSPKARWVRFDDYKYRFTDQPNGWLGATQKVDWPILVNLRLDPFERTGMYNGKDNGSIAYYNWFAYEFWRFVFVQQEVAQAAQTLIEFPPMQKGASFNMSQVKEQIQRASESHTGE